MSASIQIHTTHSLELSCISIQGCMDKQKISHHSLSSCWPLLPLLSPVPPHRCSPPLSQTSPHVCGVVGDVDGLVLNPLLNMGTILENTFNLLDTGAGKYKHVTHTYVGTHSTHTLYNKYIQENYVYTCYTYTLTYCRYIHTHVHT